MKIGDYIKQLRLEKGITQEELGKIVGVQRAAVQKWESGLVQNLKRTTIQELAQFFNVSPASFVCEIEDKNIYSDMPIDDFIYNLYCETKNLSPEQKQEFLNMTKVFVTALNKKQ